ncbi:hypothetical protein CK203_019118 [Vitis vinifera]|uniref:Uncharacterized protein n=1 Tax=Vitis vinifera TaxID=29760 RepID=A0A438J7Z6_VITVI|nr:hypothetical protein CK203_019118 [Vitis vinifera]
MEKIPIDEITKELKSLGMSEEAIKDLLQVLSIKSLTKLEGHGLAFICWIYFLLLVSCMLPISPSSILYCHP